MKVELRYAPLPWIGFLAVHYWFVVYDDAGACHRWEVWQTKNAGGTSFGHWRPSAENGEITNPTAAFRGAGRPQ